MLNGTNLNFDLPIYWAEIPISVNPCKAIGYCLEEVDIGDQYLLPDLTESIIRNRHRLVVFGDDDILQDVLFQFQIKQLVGGHDAPLRLYYGARNPDEKTERYYVQFDHDSEGFELIYVYDYEAGLFSTLS